MGSKGEARKERGRSAQKPSAKAFHAQWDRLHRGDREPWPDERLITRYANRHAAFAAWVREQDDPATVARGLQRAWQSFHAGQFESAIEQGSELGALGASVANKAAAVHTLYLKRGAARQLRLLDEATKRGTAAVAVLPDYANAHYTLALALGRYSQGISILRALAEGLATQVRTHLERTLELEPRHAEAHLALGLYHAEIVGKVGALMAGLTYGVSAAAALEHFKHATKLAPDVPIVLVEYANGLLQLDAKRHREQALELYAKAATLEPADAMERLDCEHAKGGIA
jgi:tetratricopeptide (TPR) repeat protein